MPITPVNSSRGQYGSLARDMADVIIGLEKLRLNQTISHEEAAAMKRAHQEMELLLKAREHQAQQLGTKKISAPPRSLRRSVATLVTLGERSVPALALDLAFFTNAESDLRSIAEQMKLGARGTMEDTAIKRAQKACADLLHYLNRL